MNLSRVLLVPSRGGRKQRKCGEARLSDKGPGLIRAIAAAFLAAEAERQERAKAAIAAYLRLDLSHSDYAAWFLRDKIVGGRVPPLHAVSDFVLFRIAHDWPKQAKWVLDEVDFEAADFSVSDEMAVDLVAMAQEGLHDGYQAAE